MLKIQNLIPPAVITIYMELENQMLLEILLKP